MDQMIMVLSAMMPMEMVIDRLKEDITDYEEVKLLDKSEKDIEEARKKLVFSCMLVLTKERTGDSIDKAMDFSKELEQMKKANDLLNPEKS